jgi:hypothetical protein
MLEMTDSTELPARLTRAQAAQFLTARGYKISKRYLEKLSCPSGGQGPRVDIWFGGRALYKPEDLLRWAEARCKPGDPVAAGNAKK